MGQAMRIDLQGGTYYSDVYGFGIVTQMFGPDGEETSDPSECYACVVRLSSNEWLSVPVRDMESEAVN